MARECGGFGFVGVSIFYASISDSFMGGLDPPIQFSVRVLVESLERWVKPADREQTQLRPCSPKHFRRRGSKGNAWGIPTRVRLRVEPLWMRWVSPRADRLL